MSKTLNTLDNIGTIAVLIGVGYVAFQGVKNFNNIKDFLSNLNPFKKEEEQPFFQEDKVEKTLKDFDPYIIKDNVDYRLIAVVNGQPIYSTAPQQEQKPAEIIGVKETTLEQTQEEIDAKLRANEGYTGTQPATSSYNSNIRNTNTSDFTPATTKIIGGEKVEVFGSWTNPATGQTYTGSTAGLLRQKTNAGY